jgi:rhodanese-related sulfurtransferase
MAAGRLFKQRRFYAAPITIASFQLSGPAMRYLLPIVLTALAAGVRAEVSHIDNDEFSRLLASGATVIDIRTEGEWKETGIVRGSRLMTFFDERGRADAPAWVEKLKSVARPDEAVVLICRTGNRTRVVAQFLDQQVGYRKVYNVRSGIYGWMKEKHPVVPAADALAACKSAGSC